MDKRKLTPGRKYLHHRKIVINGRQLEAERWIRCLEVTGAAIRISIEYEIFELTDQKIKEELKE